MIEISWLWIAGLVLAVIALAYVVRCNWVDSSEHIESSFQAHLELEQALIDISGLEASLDQLVIDLGRARSGAKRLREERDAAIEERDHIEKALAEERADHEPATLLDDDQHPDDLSLRLPDPREPVISPQPWPQPGVQPWGPMADGSLWLASSR
ncbi:MAG: hypothetical protein AAF196_20725, partial [Planctomycetota bacterium]